MAQRPWRGEPSAWSKYEDSLIARFKSYLAQHHDVLCLQLWLQKHITKPFSTWMWRQNLWVHTLALFVVWVAVPLGFAIALWRSFS